MKGRKGFTLIELLAVIIILAVIALISIPVVLNILDEVEKGANVSSAYAHINSIEKSLVSNYIDSNNINYENGKKYFLKRNSSFNLENDGPDDIYVNDLIKVTGDKATDGYIIFYNNSIEEAIFVINNQQIKCYNDICEYLKEHEAIESEYVTDSNIIRYNYELSSSESLTNLSSNNFNGIINGATITENGILFDGENDSIAIGQFNPQNITYDVTFKLNGFNSNQQVIAGNIQYGGCAIIISAGKDFVTAMCYIDGEYKELYTETIKVNQVYNAVLTYDGQDMKLYLDGILQDEYNNNAGITDPENSTILMLGANPNGEASYNQFFDGYIYAARFYDVALSADEINTNYEIDNLKYGSINPIDLDRKILLKYKFESDLNTTSKLIDLTGNGNDGTISSARLTNRGMFFEGYRTLDSVKVKELNTKNVTYTATFKTLEEIFKSSVTIMGNYDAGGCGVAIIKGTKLTAQCYIGDDYQYLYYDNIEYGKVYTASMTYDGQTLALYVNGVLVDSIVDTGGIVYPKNNTIFAVGGNPSGSKVEDNMFEGVIYYSDVYSRAITSKEANYLHNELTNLYGSYEGIEERYGLLVKYDYNNSENTTTVLKNIENRGYNGTFVNSSITDDGIVFDGSSSYVKVGQINTPQITYDATFKMTGESSSMSVVVGNIESGGCAIYITGGTNQLMGECYINGAYRKVYGSNLELNKVYRATLTYDGSTLKLYENKVLIDTLANSSGITYPSKSTIVTLGANPAGNIADMNYFNGRIYNAKIYNRALNATEVANYN